MTLIESLENQSYINASNGTTKSIVLRMPLGSGVRVEYLEGGLLMTLVNELNECISEHKIVVDTFNTAFEITCDIFGMWAIGGVSRYEDVSIWKKDVVIPLTQSYAYNNNPVCLIWDELFKIEDAA